MATDKRTYKAASPKPSHGRLLNDRGLTTDHRVFICYSSIVRRIHRNAWLLAILSGVLQILIFPLPNLYVFCWMALAPLVVALLRARKADTLQLNDSPGVRLVPANFGQGFLLGYLSGVIWYAGTCYWIRDTMHQYGGVNSAAAFGILLLFCLYLALYHGFFGGLLGLLGDARAGVSRAALIGAPFLWVALELARTRITGFPWQLLGTAQVDNLPLARIASVTGVYGISFEIMLVNTAFAAAFLVRKERRMTLLVASVGAAIALQAGRLVVAPKLATDHVAYLVQQNIPILENADWTKEYFQNTLHELQRTTLSPDNQAASEAAHPDLIVWPESPAPFYTSDPFFRNAISDLARESKSWVVTGSLGVKNATQSPEQATELYNSAALVNPDGTWTERYDKVHLVPFGEFVPFRTLFSFAAGLTQQVGDFNRGSSRQPLNAGNQKLGTFICYESVFPDEVRQFAKNGAEVLVNISNDGWYGDSGAYAQHLNQSRMRAIETGRWLLLDTNTGVTASVDPYGRIVARLPRKLRSTLRAPYALTNVTTFYTRYGDWFSYLCAIISLIVLLTHFLNRIKRGRSDGRRTRTGIHRAER
jgi:apolipoprotein N-acyltransferase